MRHKWTKGYSFFLVCGQEESTTTHVKLITSVDIFVTMIVLELNFRAGSQLFILLYCVFSYHTMFKMIYQKTSNENVNNTLKTKTTHKKKSKKSNDKTGNC